MTHTSTDLHFTLNEIPGALKIVEHLLALREETSTQPQTQYHLSLMYMTRDILDAVEAYQKDSLE